MDWIEIIIETTGPGVEPVTGMVLMAGIPGLVVDDPKDIRDYLAGSQAPRWVYVDDSVLGDPARATVIRAYVANNEQGKRQWEDLLQSLLSLKESDGESLYGSLSWRLRNVKEEDWENNWKAYFKPFIIGEKLVVKPTWELWDKEDGRIIVEIDPGSSFGTGQHETTRLSLELMEKYIEPGARIYDIGCGSGILMITGLLLGAGFAVGVDIEENAVRTTDENLGQNGIPADRYALYAGDLTAQSELRRKLDHEESRADLVAVNIVADIILEMAPYFMSFLKPDGRLLVSGIIDDRREEVVGRLARAGFELAESRQAGDWHALLFRIYAP
ncbi:MAG: 50S ribosomal protein L11 methyltransferase [Peptococcaceae bacterium]|jgi:ribosomal protein L11 methyltransferase|nr:50S ribosomal protein L11 methyltransferase [Peptococcaceae bacterium]